VTALLNSIIVLPPSIIKIKKTLNFKLENHKINLTLLLLFLFWKARALKSIYTMFALSSTAMKLFKIKTIKTYVDYITVFVILRNVYAQM